MKKTILILNLFLIVTACFGQTDTESPNEIVFHINSNVKNSDTDYFKEIVGNWKDYLNSQEFVRRENMHWDQNDMPYPDYSYISLLMELRTIVNNNDDVQCTIMGLIPAKNDYYLLKTMYTQQNDSTGVVELNHIVSVYAKLVEEKYLFFSSTQYLKEIYENRKIGEINYIIHPDHSFMEEDAIKMNKFNKRIAGLFETEPIEFDYVVTNNTTDLGQVLGLNFFSYSYQPVQSGGMADNFNTIIYAGNNSEYYPHEVVHLYTNAKFPRQYHPWVDEGIATLFGGSTGYELDWHLQKLKAFLANNPDYEMKELSKLQIDIPNGEFMTDFRYAIGGFLMQKIYDKEGMEGLFEALQAGRSEENYFDFLKEKLGFEKSEFENYLRNEISKLEEVTEEELQKFKY